MKYLKTLKYCNYWIADKMSTKCYWNFKLFFLDSTCKLLINRNKYEANKTIKVINSLLSIFLIYLFLVLLSVCTYYWTLLNCYILFCRLNAGYLFYVVPAFFFDLPILFLHVRGLDCISFKVHRFGY